MFCNNCGKELAEGLGFCPYCGTKNEFSESAQPIHQEIQPIQQEMPQPVAPAPQPVAEQPAYQQQVYQQFVQPVAAAPKKKKSKLPFIIVAIILVAAIVVAGVIFLPDLLKKEEAAEEKLETVWLVSSTDIDGKYKTEITYDEKGNVTNHKEYEDGVLTSESVSEYDDKGYLIKETEYYDGEEDYSWTYEYDGKGNCTRPEGKPCRYPEKMRYSIESIGGNVGKTVSKLLGIELEWIQDGKVPSYFVLCGGLLKKM